MAANGARAKVDARLEAQLSSITGPTIQVHRGDVRWIMSELDRLTRIEAAAKALDLVISESVQSGSADVYRTERTILRAALAPQEK